MPVGSSHPFHLRRRHSGETLSQAQNDRFRAEQNMKRRDELGELIREHVKRTGLVGFREIEALACQAWEEFYGGDPGQDRVDGDQDYDVHCADRGASDPF